MYKKRMAILVIAGTILLGVCVLRLIDMQLLSTSFYREQVAQLRIQSGSFQQVRTMRGKILDRKGRILAEDEPKFWLAINYDLSRYLDERVLQALSLRVKSKEPDANISGLQQEFADRQEDIELLIDKCLQFGMPRQDVVARLQKINDKIWNLRTFFAWARNGPGSDILKKYGRNLNNVPLTEALADFEKKFPDPCDRLLLINKVDDIAELKKAQPVVELKSEDAVFAARVEFLKVPGVEVIAKGQRVYPFGQTASQTIGWVGPPGQKDKNIFADDRLANYLDDELCGREDGVEYVCEPILRGKRGEIVYDIDRNLVRQTEAQFGQDVRLTIDIELQKKIEQLITNCSQNPNCKSPIAAVVIDAGSGDILALASLPNYDLNLARQTYGKLISDPCEPLRNRAINMHYPPGSAIKPLILTAGMEAGKITAGEVISCPSHRAPQGWPNCLIFLRNHWGHDSLWSNTARNAIKGSCNVYFSHLADRIDPIVLQSWFFRFGYGRLALPYSVTTPPQSSDESPEPNYPVRLFRQVQGQISNTPAKDTITSFEQLPSLEPDERRWFGIGQGNLRVTPLQVANAMACLARGGVYLPPRLIADPCSPKPEPVNLNISPATLATVYEGMHAVMEESGGTANREFAPVLGNFSSRGIRLYGKTGSTTQPEHAWFAGFAKDTKGRTIAVSVLVEGGQQGSTDAAPLGRDILLFCAEAGYLGYK
ncbi:MAG: penicillin-binding transpeptidase domain-containing protein [Sedimentisphaerales bacterium]|jgi:penicillin-binding protein 2